MTDGQAPGTTVIRPALDELPTEAAQLWLASRRSVLRGVATWMTRGARPRELLVLIAHQRSDLGKLLTDTHTVDVDLGDHPDAPLVAVLGPEQARIFARALPPVALRVASMKTNEVPVLIYPAAGASAGLCFLTVVRRAEQN